MILGLIQKTVRVSALGSKMPVKDRGMAQSLETRCLLINDITLQYVTTTITRTWNPNPIQRLVGSTLYLQTSKGILRSPQRLEQQHHSTDLGTRDGSHFKGMTNRETSISLLTVPYRSEPLLTIPHTVVTNYALIDPRLQTCCKQL